MAAILIKNVPDSLKRELKRQAERNHRSMNQQALAMLEQAVHFAKPIKFPKPIKTRKPISGEEVVRMIRRFRDGGE